jgi:hypothetical protein
MSCYCVLIWHLEDIDIQLININLIQSVCISTLKIAIDIFYYTVLSIVKRKWFTDSQWNIYECILYEGPAKSSVTKYFLFTSTSTILMYDTSLKREI